MRMGMIHPWDLLCIFAERKHHLSFIICLILNANLSFWLATPSGGKTEIFIECRTKDLCVLSSEDFCSLFPRSLTSPSHFSDAAAVLKLVYRLFRETQHLEEITEGIPYFLFLLFSSYHVLINVRLDDLQRTTFLLRINLLLIMSRILSVCSVLFSSVFLKLLNSNGFRWKLEGYHVFNGISLFTITNGIPWTSISCWWSKDVRITSPTSCFHFISPSSDPRSVLSTSWITDETWWEFRNELSMNSSSPNEQTMGNRIYYFLRYILLILFECNQHTYFSNCICC